MMKQTMNEGYVKIIIVLAICVGAILAGIYKLCIYDCYKAAIN